MLQAEREDLYALLHAYGRSPSDLTADRVQTSPDPDRTLDLLATIEEKETKLNEKIQTLIELKAAISTQIQQLDDQRYVDVLHSRYVLCRKWEQIAEDMHMADRWVFSLHGQALKEFSKQFAPFSKLIN